MEVAQVQLRGHYPNWNGLQYAMIAIHFSYPEFPAVFLAVYKRRFFIPPGFGKVLPAVLLMMIIIPLNNLACSGHKDTFNIFSQILPHSLRTFFRALHISLKGSRQYIYTGATPGAVLALKQITEQMLKWVSRYRGDNLGTGM